MFGHFYNQLNAKISSGVTSNKLFAVCYIDLDHFFEIQQDYGHEVSEIALQSIHERVKSILGPDDFLSQSASDQFFLFVAIENLDSNLAQLCEYINIPIKIFDYLISVTASIGVHILKEDDKSPDHVIRNAIEACIQVKHEGGNSLHIYDDEAVLLRRKKREIVDRVIGDLENNHFELYLQPKYDLRNLVVIGFEALIRWIDPERGIISPAVLFDAIAGTEAERLIDEFVLEEAITILKNLQKLNRTLSLSINVSPAQLMSPWFASQVESYFAKYPILMEHLRLEILESDTFKNLDLFKAHLDNLKQFGITLSLDDFGTGFASLTHLLMLPINEVKIDRSFITSIDTNEINQMIVKNVVELAEKLNISTVVEGIESKDELSMVQKLGVHGAQGYYLARPFPSSKLKSWWSEQLQNSPL